MGSDICTLTSIINLTDNSMMFLVYNNAYGYLQPNGRYLYGDYFSGPNGITQYVELYEPRSKGSGSPDNYEMGIITAYCLSSAYVVENLCPSWVNATL